MRPCLEPRPSRCLRALQLAVAMLLTLGPDLPLAAPPGEDPQSGLQPAHGHTMSARDFVKLYEQALATQDWDEVAPLISNNASVTFSDGSVHKGKQQVRAAFERNFAAIADETYRILDVHWLLDSDDVATYLFDFHWTGTIQGQPAEGGGRGTAVVIREGGKWQLLTEHLGPPPPPANE